MSRVRRLASMVRITLCLAAAAAACLLAFAVPAWAASTGPTASTPSCSSINLGSAAATSAEDAPDAVGEPSDSLDATRQCGASPTPDQSRYEAILTGVGLIAFGGATLFYRHRRQRGALAS